MNTYLQFYLIFINVLAVIIYYVDKKKAIAKKWRIKESVLISLSFLGGGIGSLIAMNVFHHKTQKFKFKVLVPLGLILSIIILYFILKT